MGIYRKHIFPRVMDWAMHQLDELRPGTLARAHGEVLEIGFGTGLNLPHYPSSVRKLVALDPLDALPARVEGRIARAPFPVERFTLSAEGGLPFEDGRFDCVTMTWTLCSIAQPLPALQEMRRVLRPDGQLLFIEHGLSEDPGVARWQRRLSPLHRRVTCGCNLDRPIDDLLRKAGFVLPEIKRFVLEQGPRIFTATYQGLARP
ncbi:MAG: class I SAM-dependent methyltransferase [Myxococcales bacterium]|nr:class I SAM-dependent methyltransferase [Myxococcales bacterium]